MANLAVEFRQFLLKQNALALAVGIIIGSAINKVVSGIVEDVLMPIIGVFLPGGAWRNAQWPLTPENAIKYGDLLGRFIDFVIIAMVVFFITKAILPKPGAAAPTKTCGQCLETVPEKAIRCRACAQPL